MELTIDHVRTIMTTALGLGQPLGRAAEKADVLAAIRRLGALQIDTINVVARAPYLALWSRLGAYQTRWLDELLVEGALFEYWAHEASFLPIEDFGLHRHRMLEANDSWRSGRDWMRSNREVVEAVLAEIRSRGPLRSADFQRRGGKGNGWWDWKPEKRALEALFYIGEVMVARRENFQRVYDLRERVLPGWDDARLPDKAETRRRLALQTVRALGVTQDRWVDDYYRTPKRSAGPILEALAAEGLLLRVQVAGWETPCYLHPDNLPLAEAALAGRLPCTHTTLLSPFDALVWDRARTLAVFGLDCRIECYLPAEKRRYGYFMLPILHRGRLVGRLDPKAHRQQGLFEVKMLYLEPDVALDDELVAGLAGALRDCAAWHGAGEVAVRASDPPALAGELQRVAN